MTRSVRCERWKGRTDLFLDVAINRVSSISELRRVGLFAFPGGKNKVGAFQPDHGCAGNYMSSGHISPMDKCWR